MNWKKEIRSSESTKRVGSVREVDMHEDELRMEVYLHSIMKLPQIDHEEGSVRSVLCVAAGLKCMIAAMVRSFPYASSRSTTGTVWLSH